MGRLKLDELEYLIQGHPILKNISLLIEEGEFVVIVGPSGCGKSSLLRLIAGFESPTQGRMTLNDQYLDPIPPARRDIAMVFQNYALYPHMTVFDNMAYCLKLRGMGIDEIKQQVLQVAKILQLEDYLFRYPQALSGGQRQRVAMGRAMIRNPSVFLFDEPLSNLDAQLRKELRYEIKKLHQTLKTTTLYVTHDYVEAMTLADRIVVMNQGKIEQMGTPEEIYHYPATTFVAEFMGHYPINFFDAHWDSQAKKFFIASTIELVNPQFNIDEIPDKLVVGIRPEQFSVSKATLPHFYAEVVDIENLGAEKWLTCLLENGQKIGVRMTDEGIVSHKIGLDCNWAHVHIFCSETHQRIGGWGDFSKNFSEENRRTMV